MSTFLKTILVLMLMLVIGSSLAPLQPVYAQQPVPTPTPTTPPPSPGLGSTGLQNDVQFENCGGIIDPFMCALGWVLLLIGNALAWFSGILLNLAVSLLGYMLTIDKRILSEPIVITGFGLSLNTANLFFVLIVIVISFMTILRVEQYGIKKLLPRLIIAVILVNFSLLFAGAILDFAHVLSSEWIGKINPEAIGKALQPQAIYKAKIDADQTAKFVTTLLIILVSIAYIAIFTILAGIVILTTAIMILIRYIWLVFLLILMPFAWLLWATPYYTEYGKKWWDKFLQWALFLPIVVFFIYLAFNTGARIGSSTISENFTNVNLRSAQGTLIEDFLSIAINMIVTLGIMVGGLIAAQKFGIAAAGAGVGFAKSVGRFGRNVAGRAALGTVKKFGGLTAAQRATNANRISSRLLSIKNTRFGRYIPGLTGLANRFAGVASNKKAMEDAKKKYSNFSKEQLQSILKGSLPILATDKAALLEAASEKKAIEGDIPPENLKALAAAAKSANPGLDASDIKAIKDLVDARPDYGPEFIGKSIAEATQKIRSDKASDIGKEALKNEDVVVNLTQSQIANIYRSGSAEKVTTLRSTYESMLTSPALKSIGERIAKLQGDIKEARSSGDKGRLSGLQAGLRPLLRQRDTILASASTSARLAYEKLNVLDQKIGNP